MSDHLCFYLFDIFLFEPLWNLFSHITYLLRIYIKINILTSLFHIRIITVRITEVIWYNLYHILFKPLAIHLAPKN